MNPIKELERQLKDANKALEESLKNSKEKAKIENAILVLEKKITPLSKRLKELREKSKPYYDNINDIHSKIATVRSSMIGPWVISEREARLYHHDPYRKLLAAVCWVPDPTQGAAMEFRGVLAFVPAGHISRSKVTRKRTPFRAGREIPTESASHPAAIPAVLPAVIPDRYLDDLLYPKRLENLRSHEENF